MSADLLRRAAEKLRQHAEKAAFGQWDAEPDGLVWSERLGDPVSGSTYDEDADYIALMHPPVALALAGLLECEANVADLDAHAHPGAFVVARAVLREPEGGAS